MKPDCQQVLTQFASFSVEELSDSEAATLLHHIEECEPCKGQWLLFEKSLTVVTQSGPRDEDVEQHRSQQMWLVCMEHARQKAEGKAEKKHALPVATVSAHAEVKSSSGGANGEGEPRNAAVLTAPRIGMTLVGGALLMLTSTYAVAAQPAPKPAQIKVAAPMVDYGSTLTLSQISTPSVSSLIAAPTKNLFAAKSFLAR